MPLKDLKLTPQERFNIKDAVNKLHLICETTEDPHVAGAILQMINTPLRAMQLRLAHPQRKVVKISANR
jgi:hypothetical protein